MATIGIKNKEDINKVEDYIVIKNKEDINNVEDDIVSKNEENIKMNNVQTLYNVIVIKCWLSCHTMLF